jgi:hypothetical protein
MIKALFILNSNGLKVESLIKKTDSFFHTGNTQLEELISSIFVHYQYNYPVSSMPVEIVDQNLPSGVVGYHFVHAYDLFITFFEEKPDRDLTKLSEVIKLISLRQSLRSFYKGIVVADFDDTMGPVPIYNNSPLEEGETTMLAVQGTTVLGMGMTTIPAQLVGPVPVPRRPNYSFMAFGYQRPAPGSNDPRILSVGRPAIIFLILDHVDTLDKEVKDFAESYLFQWVQAEVAQQEILNLADLARLHDNLMKIIILAKDLVRLRTIQIAEIKELLIRSSTENLLLKEEISHLKAQLEAKKS